MPKSPKEGMYIENYTQIYDTKDVLQNRLRKRKEGKEKKENT